MVRIPHYAIYGGPPPIPPSPLGISPTSGPGGTFVGVYGNAMNTATAVTFNGVPMDNFTVVGTGMLQGNVPAGPVGPCGVTIVYPGGTVACPEDFDRTGADEDL